MAVYKDTFSYKCIWTFQTGEAKWKHLLDAILFKQKLNLELWRELEASPELHSIHIDSPPTFFFFSQEKLGIGSPLEKGGLLFYNNLILLNKQPLEDRKQFQC